MNNEKEASEMMFEIASYHLSNGCDETCDFYRNGNCDAIPLYCTWIKLHQYFKIKSIEEDEQLKEQKE